MTLNQVLANSNINGEVYACDVARWLDRRDTKLVDKVQRELTEMRNGKTE